MNTFTRAITAFATCSRLPRVFLGCMWLLLSSAAAVHGKVIFNEIMLDPNNAAIGPWFELHNTERTAVSLESWFMYATTSGFRGSSIFRFAPDATIAANGFMIIGKTNSIPKSVLWDSLPLFDRTGAATGNSYNCLVLHSKGQEGQAGVWEDRVEWNTLLSEPLRNLPFAQTPRFTSLSRRDLRIATQDPTNWCPSASSLSGPDKATPLRSNIYTCPPPARPPTKNPTREPTKKPTKAATKKPTTAPTKQPTRAPTKRPSKAPTKKPTKAPTKRPSNAPTKTPTMAPTKAPTMTLTEAPTAVPLAAGAPMVKPMTAKPTKAPTQKPTNAPERAPVMAPMATPVMVAPMAAPVVADAPVSKTSNKPATAPLAAPTTADSPVPRPSTEKPIVTPAESPTVADTPVSKSPIKAPTKNPSVEITKNPMKLLTMKPTRAPVAAPVAGDQPVAKTLSKTPTRSPTTVSTAPVKAPIAADAPMAAPVFGASAPVSSPTRPNNDKTCSSRCTLFGLVSGVRVHRFSSLRTGDAKCRGRCLLFFGKARAKRGVRQWECGKCPKV